MLPLLVDLVTLLGQLFPSQELVFKRPDWLVAEKYVLHSFLRLQIITEELIVLCTGPVDCKISRDVILTVMDVKLEQIDQECTFV